ncbi:hypothetical protein PV416_37695 [Streptomyces ipomoeae]|uniref:hypothetical protein n=1 Tax=Streptomyces ipomoeae TaxID=103232 RepID=UPI001146FED3|nr:hypothetical protein [Streptomyces ipomoeae]MDX2826656.1 hypothetical protein [Streptomyces ipomoeae]MDX2879172.1 hypothetical protein [Streptomyces ipomoeae]TQE40205.1 hypothetical protein Sipo7851_01490 [Streptomyces ipomoeae]
MVRTNGATRSVFVSTTSRCARLSSGSAGWKNAGTTVTRDSNPRLTIFSGSNRTGGALLQRDFKVNTDLQNFWADMT